MCGEAYFQSSRIAEQCEPLVPATEATKKNLSETNLGSNAHVASNAHVGTAASAVQRRRSRAALCTRLDLGPECPIPRSLFTPEVDF
jgi:hypothetical protein